MLAFKGEFQNSSIIEITGSSSKSCYQELCEPCWQARQSWQHIHPVCRDLQEPGSWAQEFCDQAELCPQTAHAALPGPVHCPVSEAMEPSLHRCLLDPDYIYLLFISNCQTHTVRIWMKTEHRRGAVQVGRGGRWQHIQPSVSYLGNSGKLHRQQLHGTGNRDGSCSRSSVWGSHLPPEFRNCFPLRTTGYLSASLLSGQISPSAANTTLWFVSWNFFSSSSGPPAKITS